MAVKLNLPSSFIQGWDWHNMLNAVAELKVKKNIF